MSADRCSPDRIAVARVTAGPGVAWLMCVLVACRGSCARAEPASVMGGMDVPTAQVMEVNSLVGVCEPSGAVAGQAGSVWIADDDQEDRLFRWSSSGGAPVPVLLSAAGAKAPVEDIEALAVRNETLWILGSHSRSRKGKLGRRAQLIAVDPGRPQTVLHRSTLWPDKKSDQPDGLVAAVAAHCPDCVPDGSWADVELEGMVWSADGTRLFLGVRAPIARAGSAFVLVMAATEANGTVALDPIDVHVLELGGRGVRAMVRAPDEGGYWLVAGPPADSHPDAGGFAIYSWSLPQAPRLLAHLPSFDGSPEALLPLGPSEALIFTDEGDRLKAGALAAQGAAHRSGSDDKPKFRCGATPSAIGAADWAHVIRTQWGVSVSDPPPIR